MPSPGHFETATRIVMTEQSLQVLAIVAHPDDAELGCGGTLAHLARLGQRVGILDLTRGELGSRGTPALREQEAAKAGQILGITTRRNAGLPDGGLDPANPEQRLAVIRILRELRPHTVITCWPEVRHPDHRHASQLVEQASFRAGLFKLDTGTEPFRPSQLLYYMEHYPFEPTLVVDVTDDYATKTEAILAYSSQFFADPDTDSDQPATHLTRPEFLEGVDARARAYGELAGFRYGEPFRSRGPLAVAQPGLLTVSTT